VVVRCCVCGRERRLGKMRWNSYNFHLQGALASVRLYRGGWGAYFRLGGCDRFEEGHHLVVAALGLRHLFLTLLPLFLAPLPLFLAPLPLALLPFFLTPLPLFLAPLSFLSGLEVEEFQQFVEAHGRGGGRRHI
jgi:hypothetical protein